MSCGILAELRRRRQGGADRWLVPPRRLLELPFKIAGSMAFKEAMKRAKPKLLEPTAYAVEV